MLPIVSAFSPFTRIRRQSDVTSLFVLFCFVDMLAGPLRSYQIQHLKTLIRENIWVLHSPVKKKKKKKTDWLDEG